MNIFELTAAAAEGDEKAVKKLMRREPSIEEEIFCAVRILCGFAPERIREIALSMAESGELSWAAAAAAGVAGEIDFDENPPVTEEEKRWALLRGNSETVLKALSSCGELHYAFAAANPNVSEEILENLISFATSRKYELGTVKRKIRVAAALNPSSPEYLLWRIERDERSAVVLLALSSSPFVSEYLARSAEHDIINRTSGEGWEWPQKLADNVADLALKVKIGKEKWDIMFARELTFSGFIHKKPSFYLEGGIVESDPKRAITLIRKILRIEPISFHGPAVIPFSAESEETLIRAAEIAAEKNNGKVLRALAETASSGVFPELSKLVGKYADGNDKTIPAKLATVCRSSLS
jgi:hypothetical protein